MNEHDLFQKYNKSPVKKGTGPLVPSYHILEDRNKIGYIKNLLKRLWNVNKHINFPQPVSLERKNFEGIISRRYVIAEKTDGVRYLMLMGTYPRELCRGSALPFAVMINRKYEMYEVTVVAQKSFYKGSLFDGELVWEYDDRSEDPYLIYFVFDIVGYRGVSIGHRDYIQRYEHIVSIFSYPRHENQNNIILAQQRKVISDGNRNGLEFAPKKCYPLPELRTLWRRRNQLGHQSDGLIFTPVGDPVRTGRHESMFKWKPEHTVDFRIEGTFDLDTSAWTYEIYCGDCGKEHNTVTKGIRVYDPVHRRFSLIPLVFLPSLYLKKVEEFYQSRGMLSTQFIGECILEIPTQQDWIQYDFKSPKECSDPSLIPVVEAELQKIRHDKQYPNDLTTVERTVHNAFENITIRDLVTLAQTNARAPKLN